MSMFIFSRHGQTVFQYGCAHCPPTRDVWVLPSLQVFFSASSVSPVNYSRFVKASHFYFHLHFSDCNWGGRLWLYVIISHSDLLFCEAPDDTWLLCIGSQVAPAVENLPASAGDARDVGSWVQSLSWKEPLEEGKWQPPPLSLPWKFHGQESFAGSSPWGHKESDMTEHSSFYS